MTTSDEVKGKYFPVLNHGFVALVDYMGGDAAVVQAARVSYGPGTKTVSDDRGLIRYLVRQRHSTPLEMVELKFHVKLPIFVARQLIRHRTANVNEFSMRYSLAPLQFYIPEFEVFRKQSSANRQGRSEQTDRETYDRLMSTWKVLYSHVSSGYVDALTEEIARELARVPLSLGLYTEWYWKIDLHNLLHFLTLRTDSHAQWEIQEFARIKAGLARCVAPLAFEAWIDYARCAVTFSRMEMNCLIGNMGRVTSMTDAEIAVYGLSVRELGEFKAKLTAQTVIPNFDLDLTTAKDPTHFHTLAMAAVPSIDR
jgi:thymidylate synthase (FAD)